jgi:hypothetical protein
MRAKVFERYIYRVGYGKVGQVFIPVLLHYSAIESARRRSIEAMTIDLTFSCRRRQRRIWSRRRRRRRRR